MTFVRHQNYLDISILHNIYSIIHRFVIVYLYSSGSYYSELLRDSIIFDTGFYESSSTAKQFCVCGYFLNKGYKTTIEMAKENTVVIKKIIEMCIHKKYIHI